MARIRARPMRPGFDAYFPDRLIGFRAYREPGHHPAPHAMIPRGGKGLIERISAEAKVPVIKHLDGN
eukprot:gene43745-59243_t